MTKERAKNVALKIVRGWGYFRSAMWPLPSDVVAYAPYLPFFQTPNLSPVGVDIAAPGSEYVSFLMARIEQRVIAAGFNDPVLIGMHRELIDLRTRAEHHPVRQFDVLLGRERAVEFERRLRRYAEVAENF